MPDMWDPLGRRGGGPLGSLDLSMIEKLRRSRSFFLSFKRRELFPINRMCCS